MALQRKGSARWQGDLKSGKGAVSTESGVLDWVPYGFSTRFEDEPGTNPEELIGAAHAGCFSMAFAMILSEAGLVVEKIDTSASVKLEKADGGFAITAVHLTVQAKVPGASNQQFEELAAKAKAGCPVSKLLKADISMDASLLD